MRMQVPYHPPGGRELRGPLTAEGLAGAFSGCADFQRRRVALPAGGEAELCWIDGMVKTERLNDFIIRPLTTLPLGPRPEERILSGGIWTSRTERCDGLAEGAEALVNGDCIIFLNGCAVRAPVSTEEKRSIPSPENETDAKGANDAFVESVRTNTSLVRRRVRTSFLRVEEFTLGRASKTPVDLLWVEDLTDRRLVERVRARLERVDIDAVLATEHITAFLTREGKSPFPQLLYTERPDRFCEGLLEGQVGVLADGIPQGCLLPGTAMQFLQTPQDKNYHPMAAIALMIVRFFCVAMTLVLPGFYIAVATFHFEMIPVRLAESIVASRQEVPFTPPVEVLMLLLAFEILQEAGQRLPKTIGQTVSIVGGLVVGQAAVDAKIVSPVVVIAVAAAGIAGFTVPNQDMVNALRIWRFVLGLLAAALGLFGLTAGLCWMLCHLSGLNLFSVPYLSPLAGAADVPEGAGALFRVPVGRVKLRDPALRPEDRRRQR